MGNLEKAGVLVVVALLAVILVVAFLNFPEQGKAPVLGANAPKNPQAEVKKAAVPKQEPQNVYPPENDLIRPKPDGDRSSSDAPPRGPDTPVTVVPLSGTGTLPKPNDVVLTPTPPPAPISVPKTEPAPHEEKKAHSGWPKMVKVQSGDSLWAIAVREYGAKLGPKMLGAITDANPKVRPEAMKAGTELSLPAPPTEAGTVSKAGGDEPKAPAKTPSKTPAKDPAASKPSRKLPFVPE